MARSAGSTAGPLDERLQFERLVTELSASFVNLTGDAVDTAILDAQRRIADALDLDRSTLFHRDPETDDLLPTHNWHRLDEPATLAGMSGRRQFPWSFARIMRGEAAAFSSPEEIPDPVEREVVQSYLTKSRIALPLSVDGAVIGLISFATIRVARRWPEEIANRLRLLAQVFAGALAKKRADAALRRALDDLQRAYDDLRLARGALAEHERLRALAQLAAGIAHDITNALSPVSLYAETILASEPNLSAETREFLRVIQRSVQDASQTVSRLREFSREREPNWQATPVDLNTMVEQVRSLTRARWKDKPMRDGIAIELSTELASDLPPILGVESEIREALTNLVINAVEAMPSGGTITLKTLTVPGTAQEPAGSAALEVADNGAGMDDETRRRCVEPFFTTKGERGSGLGLAMVYGILRRHGADLTIDSTPGSGTRVRMTFPCQEADDPRHPSNVPAAPGAMLRVLVVDDDPVLLRTFRNILARDGHEVVATDSGAAGIEAFVDARRNGSGFDVVIADMAMPGVDGTQLAAAVKRESPSTPVILLTATRDAAPTGADGVLHKPLRINALRNALARVQSVR